MSNIQVEEIPHKEILEKIEQFIGELKNSGYSQKQSKEIVTCGIRGWKTKIKKRKMNNIPFYRVAKETVDERLRKELTERESWYKEHPKEGNTEEESPSKYRKTTGGGRLPVKRWMKTKKSAPHSGENLQVKSVIFVPHTKDSSLAKELREKEKDLCKITGDKVKIIEKAGNKLEDILIKRDPWKGADCGRPNCFP